MIFAVVVLTPIFVFLVWRSIRGFAAMSDPVSSWAKGEPVGSCRCGFDLRRPARMTGSYPLGMLTVFDGGLAVDSAVGRLEFARGQIDFIGVQRPGVVQVIGHGRELHLRLRSPDTLAALLSLH